MVHGSDVEMTNDVVGMQSPTERERERERERGKRAGGGR